VSRAKADIIALMMFTISQMVVDLRSFFRGAPENMRVDTTSNCLETKSANCLDIRDRKRYTSVALMFAKGCQWPVQEKARNPEAASTR
jgi:hypothetical protein